MNLINISSAVPANVPSDKIAIIARYKNGTDNIISPNNRVRAVLLPKTIWTNDETFQTGNNQMLQLFMHDAIEELAKQYLSTICKDSNMMRTEVPEENFQLAALLNWNAEQAAIAGRLNGDEIKSWLKDSKTIAKVEVLHSAEIAKALGAQFIKLASPNHGLTPEKADKLLSKLWQVEDADTTTGLRVMLRLQAIRDKVESTEVNVLESIL